MLAYLEHLPKITGRRWGNPRKSDPGTQAYLRATRALTTLPCLCLMSEMVCSLKRVKGACLEIHLHITSQLVI